MNMLPNIGKSLFTRQFPGETVKENTPCRVATSPLNNGGIIPADPDYPDYPEKYNDAFFVDKP